MPPPKATVDSALVGKPGLDEAAHQTSEQLMNRRG